MKELRPGIYDDMEYISPNESDLAPTLKSSEVNVLEKVDEDLTYVSSTESDLAPILKNSTAKAAMSQTVSNLTIKSYAYEFIE